jgi:hypothetical protein
VTTGETHSRRDETILWTIGRRLAMVVVLALAFVLSATVTIYVLFRGGDTRVPNVIGKSEAEAQRMAERAGLRVKIVRRSDATTPADTVIETRPGPNSSVKKDSSLTIVISSGRPESKSIFAAPPDRRSGMLAYRGGTFFSNPIGTDPISVTRTRSSKQSSFPRQHWKAL